MRKPIGYAIVSIGINILFAVLLFLPLAFLENDAVYSWLFAIVIIALLSLFIQLIVGIIYVAGEKKKELGKGMLLAVGFFLLVGLSVCTPMLGRL